MKKKPKGKQNWFKTQFKKHPYLYTFVIGWPILFYIIDEFINPIVSNRFGYILLIIFLSFPVIIFFLWFRKNKSKIKPFFKRRKKIFKPILYTLGGIGSIVGVWLIAIIISIGGVTNFVERAKFEYLVWKAESEYPSISYCSNADGVMGGIMYGGYGKFAQFGFKEATQYLDYYGKYKYLSAKEIKKADSFLPFYKGDPEIQLQLAINSKDDNLFNFNHCESTRFLLKAAHQGNKVVGKILASYPYPMMSNYLFNKSDHFFVFKDYYLFDRYDKKITEKDLDNPALVYKFAHDQKDNTIRKKYMDRAAEEGYLAAMEDITFDAFDKHDVSDCPLILKSNERLSKQKSIIASANQIWASMGRFSTSLSKAIYECSNKKTDFSKAISLLKEFKENSRRDKPDKFSHTYPGIIYFNGWGNVKQDQKLAYELFSAYDDDHKNFASGYLAYMNYKGIVIEQNQNKGKGLTIELAKKISVDKSPEDFTKNQKEQTEIELLCGGNSYNFIIPDLLILESYYDKKLSKSEKEKKRIKYKADEKINEKIIKEYRNKLGQCLFESEHEVSIKFLEDYIFNRLSDFFKNPELVKTLNYLGEPK